MIQRQTLATPVVAATLAGASLWAAQASANTASVFSPVVNEGSRTWEYRSSFAPDHGGAPSLFNHRLHYQHALDDTWRWRLVGQQRSVDGDGLEYRFTRLELLQQYRETRDTGWAAALRYEVQIADDTSPNRVRLVWTGLRDLDSHWQLRANAITGREFGDHAGSGLLLGLRGQATRRFDGFGRVGLEFFSDLNRTTDMGSFDDQSHQFGPIAKFALGGLQVDAGYLYGLSDAADQHNFRLILSYSL